MLSCGCAPLFITNLAVSMPEVGVVVANGCPCCGAAPRKKCAGGAAATVPANKHHGEFSYADVCPARAEVQEALL